jgi:phosphate transport system protein
MSRPARLVGWMPRQEARIRLAPSRGDAMMTSTDPGHGGDAGAAKAESTLGRAFPGRHAIRDQDVLWAEFLAMSEHVVNSLEKGIQVLCEGRFDLVAQVKDEEEESDRREVHIEQECLRVLALYEPVASDLRRLATILKVNRDWERIADLAARIARRARKLSRKPNPAPIPEAMSALAHDVHNQVRAGYEALRDRDSRKAREVIAGDRPIDRQYRLLRNELKDRLREQPDQLNSWLQMMSTARNLERIADHATGIAQMVVYLQEGAIIRHTREVPPSEE